MAALAHKGQIIMGGDNGVTSWNGRSGSILPMAGDYDATQINYDSSTTVKDELNEIEDDINGINLGYPMYGYTIASGEGGGFALAKEDTDSFTLLAKIEDGETYILTKSPTIGNRFRTVGFYSYPSLSRASYDTSAVSIVFDNTLSSYTFANTQGFKYLAFTVNYNNSVSGNYESIKAMICKSDLEITDYRSFNQQSIQHQINDINESGAVNRLNITATTSTSNGVIMTVNKDSDSSVTSIVFNGTPATGSYTNFKLSESIPVSKARNTKLSTGVATGTISQFNLEAVYRTGNGTYISEQQVASGEIELIIPSNAVTVEVWAQIESGYTANNLTMYPMLAPLSYTGSYVPYAMTNRELTEKAGVWTSPVSCLVDDTSATITNAAIHTTSTINPYIQTASGAVVAYSNLAITEGQAVITFGAALTEAASVKLQILNI